MDSHLSAARPAPLPGSCAGMWLDADEPAWGTASRASFWVALEQPGPWGRKAFTASRLDPTLGASFEAACADAGGRALLIRAAGDHHAATSHDARTPRRLLVAGGLATGRPWLVEGDVMSPAAVSDLPFDELGGADPAPALAAVPQLRPVDHGVLLVCTNAKRDACCAVLGRPIAVLAGAVRPGRVWECTHTGGHRFAPTAIALPGGATYARLDVDRACEAVDAAGERRIPASLLGPRTLRGLSHLAPAAQAADAHVRTQTGEEALDALTVTLGAPDGDVTPAVVTHRDGRVWHLAVRHVVDDARPRRSSCTAEPVPSESWQVDPR